MPIRAVVYASEAGPAIAGDKLGLGSGKLDAVVDDDSIATRESPAFCSLMVSGFCSTSRDPKTGCW